MEQRHRRYYNRKARTVDNPLNQWMVANGHTNASLAREMGMSHAAVYKVTSGEREPGDTFKWRFARAFGMFVAKTLFEDHDASDLGEREEVYETA